MRLVSCDKSNYLPRFITYLCEQDLYSKTIVIVEWTWQLDFMDFYQLPTEFGHIVNLTAILILWYWFWSLEVFLLWVMVKNMVWNTFQGLNTWGQENLTNWIKWIIFSIKMNNQLQGMVEDSDKVKNDSNDLTKSDHEVLGAGVHFTYVLNDLIIPEIYSDSDVN